jgi:uncharacterized protein (UPF0335 family)
LRAVIGDNIKSDIIKQWISGKSRDGIALSTGVSAGAVSNVVGSWRTALGIPVSEELRELAVALRKLGLGPSECAIGARVFKIMRSLGLNEEEGELEEFLSDIYRHSKELGVPPETIADYLKQLIDLCATVSVIEVPGYLMRKLHEKLELEAEIAKLRTQQAATKKLAEDALNQQRVTVSELQNYLKFKREMAYSGISVDDGISNFMNILDVIKKTTNFHPNVVLSKFRAMDQVNLAQIELNQLKSEINQLKEEKDAHMQVLKIYKELESFGFGLKEIRLLRNTIREIASDNGVSPDFAVMEFFSKIEEDYDAVLGFKSKLEKLKSEIQDLEFKRAAIQIQSYGVDWVSLLKSFQGGQGQVQQGQTPVLSSQEQLQTQTPDNAADQLSSYRSDPKAANFDAAMPTQQEIQSSSWEKSNSENEKKPSAEQMREFQERNKRGKPGDFYTNTTLATQGAAKNTSQNNQNGSIDAALYRLKMAADLLQNKIRTNNNLDANTNSTC